MGRQCINLSALAPKQRNMRQNLRSSSIWRVATAPGLDLIFAVFRQHLICLLVGSVNGIQGAVSDMKYFRICDFNTVLEMHISDDADGTVIWLLTKLFF